MPQITCPAKLNLFLKITGATPDHYHELESLFVFCDLCDILYVEKNHDLEFTINGEFSLGLIWKDNILKKIYDYFTDKFKISPLKIILTKNIPIAAGLAGGSSDAAGFIKALNKIFSLNLNKEKLQEIGLQFGCDIPFFFEDKPCIVKGRGELIANYPLQNELSIILVNPKINLSTKHVFQKFATLSKGNFSPKIDTKILQEKNIFDLLENFPNDLTDAAISISGEIKNILEELKNCDAKFAKMSGSGATCFGVFADNKIDEAQEKLQKKFPNYFVKKARVHS